MILSEKQIAQMSRDEKIRAMEALWADLSRNEADVESPSWHKDILEETNGRVAAGCERTTDWDAAKQELRKRFE
jgi:hypothetical protein